MHFGIFSRKNGVGTGVLRSRHNRSWEGRMRLLAAAGFVFLASLAGFSLIGEATAEKPAGAGLEASATPENEWRDLCRWRKDMAAFAALQEISVTGSLVLPTALDVEQCVAEKKTAYDAAQANAARSTDVDLAHEIREMVVGHPIEDMTEAIAAFDREVAALIVGIAKKESNWGKRVPLDKYGQDCFNYWGFKGAGARGVAMGHGCFGTPEEAVEKVGKRIAELVELRKSSDPSRMIIWKCGSSCAGHSPESVRSWIGAVDLYYQKLAQR